LTFLLNNHSLERGGIFSNDFFKLSIDSWQLHVFLLFFFENVEVKIYFEKRSWKCNTMSLKHIFYRLMENNFTSNNIIYLPTNSYRYPRALWSPYLLLWDHTASLLGLCVVEVLLLYLDNIYIIMNTKNC
jgi:hypothetical protein